MPAALFMAAVFTLMPVTGCTAVNIFILGQTVQKLVHRHLPSFLLRNGFIISGQADIGLVFAQ